eukprot:NODE_910_length_1140_cov_342.088909_g629_i0.p8 GENE.NODE_910_length_1140_cov_342.088909_g629_i0~~NODE_910_length_1140_cov_342.088909_g629_i0.p8  ORF type:complete len:56 (+),score=0.06 NODE_910_length_1140_cov_342.088909_g629_i0:527-694(+)
MYTYIYVDTCIHYLYRFFFLVRGMCSFCVVAWFACMRVVKNRSPLMHYIVYTLHP